MLFALLCLSFICLADTQTQSFIVEVEHQSESSPNQNFSIKPDPTAMPAIDMAPLLWETPSLQETPSETADTSGYPGSDSPPDNKPRRPSGLWETMTTVVESISWQALYATRDVIGYTLTLTLQKQEGSLEPITYSWMPVIATVVVGWLTSTHWNPEQPLFTQMHQQEVNLQHQLAIITLGKDGDKDGQSGSTAQGNSGNSKESSSASHPVFTRVFVANNHPINGGSGGGEPPSERPHSTDRTSYCHACCHEPCRLNTSHADKPLSPEGFVRPQPCSGHLLCNRKPCIFKAKVKGMPASSNDQEAGMSPEKKHRTSPTVVSDPACGSSIHCHLSATSESLQCTLMNTTPEEQSQSHETQPLAYDVTVVREDGQQRPCETVCQNESALSTYKSSYPTWPQTCGETVTGKDGQPQSCQQVFRYERALLSHKRKCHSGPQTCNVIVLDKNGLGQRCNKVFKNPRDLARHKSSYHTGSRICDVEVTGEDGQKRLCGKNCKHAQDLAVHKSNSHRPRICDVIVVGGDGQERSCGVACQNARALLNHQSTHTKRKHDENDQDSHD